MKYLFKKYCDNGFWILAPILNIYKALLNSEYWDIYIVHCVTAPKYLENFKIIYASPIETFLKKIVIYLIGNHLSNLSSNKMCMFSVFLWLSYGIDIFGSWTVVTY